MSTATISAPIKLPRKDFASDQEVRWCPGCGDYSILAQVQKVMPELNVARENIVFISGIGCSSRFPYYMNTYGFHSIHGRAMTLATGLKVMRPELSVWVITGDGDGLSIGGNHFLHCLRRNLDINVILFNNRIYGLTKGQYSPTSEFGKKTKSSPQGTIEQPINPVRAAIAAEATWVGRSMDTDTKHLPEMIRKMAAHKGVSFLEVFQNCNIFNDGAYENFGEKSVRADRMIQIEPGKPMRFGKDGEKAIRMKRHELQIIEPGKDGSRDDEAIVYDATDQGLAYTICQMDYPEFPVPVGVFVDIERETYDDLLEAQVAAAKAKPGAGDLQRLLSGGNTWKVT